MVAVSTPDASPANELQADHWAMREAVSQDADARHEREQQILSESHLPWEMERRPPELTENGSWARRHWLGPVALVECAAIPTVGHRRRPELAATDGEWVSVLMTLRGHEQLAQGDSRADMRPGSMVVWHSTAEATFDIREPLRKRSLFIPRALIARRCPTLRWTDAYILPSESSAVGLFGSFVTEVARRVETLDGVARATAADVIVDLLVACLRPHHAVGPKALHAGLFARACAHIEQRLHDPALRPPRVAADLGLSLRTLHAVFAEHEQTVAGFVRGQRLARCHEELLRDDGRTVTEIAFAWGFTNSAHFSRIFRQRFGVSPRELRASARVGDSVLSAHGRLPVRAGRAAAR